MGVPTLFDRIIRGEVPSHRVAEGEHWYSFLDIFPRCQGHTLVVPKQSVQHITSLSQASRSALFEGVAEVQRRLSLHFSTSDFTICVHDGPLAGQEVPHVHVHVLPRQTGDGGLTLHSMWPHSPPMGGEIDHGSLALLSEQLREVGQ